jgi:hypothetical protein
MKKKKSEFGKITSTELLNAVYYGCAGAATTVLAVVAKGSINLHTDGLLVAGAFLGPFFGCIFKHGATNSEGKLFKKEG